MNYWKRCPEECPLLGGCPIFSEGPLSEVPLYTIKQGLTRNFPTKLRSSSSQKAYGYCWLISHKINRHCICSNSWTAVKQTDPQWGSCGRHELAKG